MVGSQTGRPQVIIQAIGKNMSSKKRGTPIVPAGVPDGKKTKDLNTSYFLVRLASDFAITSTKNIAKNLHCFGGVTSYASVCHFVGLSNEHIIPSGHLT